MRNFVSTLAQTVTSWRTWDIDIPTIGWIIWMVYFAVWETWTGIKYEGEMLTNHLRPIFQSIDLSWFLALGLWIWLGFHFLIDGVDFREVFNIGPRN